MFESKLKEVKLETKTVHFKPMDVEIQKKNHDNWLSSIPEGTKDRVDSWFDNGLTTKLNYDSPQTVKYTTLDLNQPYVMKTISPIPIAEPVVSHGGADDAVRVRNFNFVLIKRIIHRERPDSEEEIKIQVELTLKDDRKKTPYHLLVRLEDYSNLYAKIRAVHPQCYASNLDGFYEEAAVKYRQLCDSLKDNFYTYGFSGWYEVSGKLCFLEASMPNVTNRKYRLEFDKEKARQFLPMYWNISHNKHHLLLLLLACCWAGMDKFFCMSNLKTKGFNAVVYLSAPTGTGKTTLATIFTKALLAESQEPCLRFEDTIASLEEAIVSSRDVPVIVDDFFAQGSKAGDASYEHKASAITRIAGDRLLRGKCGADRRPRDDREYRGTIIATGEYIKLNTQSSYLRCWQLFFPKGSILMNENLSILSSDPSYAKSFMSGWIQYLTERQDIFLKYLPENHKVYELMVAENHLNREYARLGANTAALLSVGWVLSCYCKEALGYSDEQIAYDLDKKILEAAMEQLDGLQETSPVEIWRKAFLDLIDSGELRLGSSQEAFNDSEWHGFYAKDGTIWCAAAIVEKLMARYLDAHGIGLRITTQLLSELAEKGIIIKHNNEVKFKYSTNRSVTPARPRMFQINLKK